MPMPKKIMIKPCKKTWHYIFKFLHLHILSLNMKWRTLLIDIKTFFISFIIFFYIFPCVISFQFQFFISKKLNLINFTKYIFVTLSKTPYWLLQLNTPCCHLCFAVRIKKNNKRMVIYKCVCSYLIYWRPLKGWKESNIKRNIGSNMRDFCEDELNASLIKIHWGLSNNTKSTPILPHDS
jgi:hypothetical protein